jgi:hypothetical protein
MVESQGLFDGVFQSRQILEGLSIWMVLKPNSVVVREEMWLNSIPYLRVPDLAFNFFEYVPMAGELVNQPRNRNRDRVLHTEQM